VRNGQLGTLMAKAIKKAQKARLDNRKLSENGYSLGSSTMSKVPTAR
jgi:hypothetical protein